MSSAQKTNQMEVSLPSDCEIRLTRTFNAPQRLVFEAITQPRHVRNWFACFEGSSMPVCEIDLRLGGKYTYTTRMGDGNEFTFYGEYREITPFEQLIYTEIFEPFPDAVSVVTVTLEETAGRTVYTSTSLYPSPEVRDMVLGTGMEHGAALALDRLEDVAHNIATRNSEVGEMDLVIQRTFNAPSELVYRAWTEPERLNRWWGPKGMNTRLHRFELEPGGIMHYAMQPPGTDQLWWGRFVFWHVAPGKGLTYVNSFSDKNAGITRAPFAETWPLEMLTVITLSEQGGQTLLTLRSMPINATEAEMETFKAGHASMNQGFGGTMQQLEEELANFPN